MDTKARSLRHMPLITALCLAACGGGSATNGTSPAVLTVTGGEAVASVGPIPASAAPASPTGDDVEFSALGALSDATGSIAGLVKAGLPFVSSGLNVGKLLGSNRLPVTAAPDVVGAFRFLCGPGQVLPDDPIMYPGQPGKAHLHQFFGNLGANANSTYASLRTSGESTCQNELNRSAYWMPAMLDGRGNAVRPDFVSIYYKRWPKTNKNCTTGTTKGCADLPRGFRLIFGWDQTRPKEAQPENTAKFNFKCVANGHPVSATFPNMADALKVCRAGQQLTANIGTPVCWDGVNLDSPDHRSHTADAKSSGCPKTHPYRIPTFSMGVQWTIAAGDDPTKWMLASDHMKPGARAGETFHSDYFEGWEEAIRDRWHAACIDKLLSCSDGDLGDGQIMARGKHYPKGVASPRLVAAPAMRM